VQRTKRLPMLGVLVACVCVAQTAQPTPEQTLARMLADLRGDDPNASSPYKSLFDPQPPQISARLVPAKGRAPAGYISVEELTHKPPREARRWASRGMRLARRGDHAGAAADFEKAIAVDPDFALGHHRLGLEDIQLDRLAQGEEELRRTVQMEPHAVGPAFDLSALLYREGNFSEAERNVRRVLGLSDTFAPAHLLLGLILIGGQRDSAEGVHQIQYVARTIPDAIKILADLRKE
jgi:tetratricopeptide (TPR) repeat protein